MLNEESQLLLETREWLTRALKGSFLQEGSEFYLLGRGAKRETLNEIGAANFDPPLDPCPYSEWHRKYGVYWERLSGRIALPLYSPTGKLLGFDSRPPGQKNDRRIMLPQASWSPVWIGMSKDTVDKIWSGASVWIVEGFYDYFAMEHILPEGDVLLGSGPAHLNRHHVEFLRRVKPSLVNLCLDRDAAGYKGMKDAQRDLSRVRIQSRILSYGKDGDDPGDIWDRGGKKALQDAFERYLW